MPRALIAFEPPDGGVPQHVAELATGLPAHGWEVEVAGPERAITWSRLEAAGTTIHRIAPLVRGYGRPWRELAALRELTGLIRRGHFDLVHCHSSKAGALGRIAASRASTPALYTPHGFGFVGEVSALRRAVVPAVERALGRQTAALICVSDAELAEAQRRRIGSPATRHRIHNGCEPCGATEPVTALAGSGRPRAGAVSVLRPGKGLEVVIDATPRILAAVPEATVALIGEGPLRSELERRAAALGLDSDPRFRFLGFEPPSSRYLSELDLFVLPSFAEAFPLALLEALACGVPQVASAVGGVPEAIGADTGVLVRPGEPADLADAVVALLRDSERRERMSAASRERWRSRFRLEPMIAATDRLYRSVLAGG